MKIIIAIAAFALSACATTAPQSPPVAPSITGGWSASPITPDVTGAANFAARQMAAADVTVDSISDVETQVVAGTNYRFEMNLSDGQFVKVAVWKKLDGSMELLSIARPVSD